MNFKYFKTKKSCILQLLVALLCTSISCVEWVLAFTNNNSQRTVRRYTTLQVNSLQQSKTDGYPNLPPDRLPESLIGALDIAPLLERVSNHAGTRRGREAILDLVSYRQTPTAFPKANKLSRRDSLMLSATRRSSLVSGGRPASKVLSPVATSSTEARKEYELVEEALIALGDNAYDLTYPPIYAVGSSPIDGETVMHTDDDEWLDMPADSWTLENLSQAEQVIRRLITVKEWGDLDETRTWMPGLSDIGRQIDDDNELPSLYSEIDGAVDIVRVRTLDDPEGKSTYTFRIKCEKFPILKLLRDKESMLLDLGRKPMDREMISILEEIEEVESQIQMGLAQSILGKYETLQRGMDSITRLDTIFARAGFGYTLNGQIPKISNEGTILVVEFIHPVLATNDGFSLNADAGKIGKVVPVDLELCSDAGKRALIISGPNGGGKTLSMKSFGLVSVMAKLGLPIPVSTPSKARPRVDYFKEILVDVGDQQDALFGTSTWTSKLNSWASIISRLGDDNTVSQSPDQSSDSLILLDELGSGTDPEAGGAVAQAILEELMAFPSCHIVATTHSPRLKSLSYQSCEFNCAAVLLDGDSDIPGSCHRPSFRLSYGTIGESHAMVAASRCSPSLPESVLSRASELMTEKSSSSSSSSDDIGSRSAYIRSLTSSMEKQVKRTENEREAAIQDATASARCRKAMLSLAASFESHLTRLEQRLDDSYTKLKQETDDDLEIVGGTLAELRVVKKQVKSQEELLRDKGLKFLPPSYLLQPGESVVILATGEWEGTTVEVVATSESDNRLRPTEILVKPSSSFLSWDEMFDENADIGIDMMLDRPLIIQRHELAIWDYDNLWDYDDDVANTSTTKATSVADSKRRLNSVLSTLKTEASTKKSDPSGPISNFTSSRQRKAAKNKKRKKKK